MTLLTVSEVTSLSDLTVAVRRAGDSDATTKAQGEPVGGSSCWQTVIVGPETPSDTVTLPFNSSSATVSVTRTVSESLAVKVVPAPEPARQRPTRTGMIVMIQVVTVTVTFQVAR